MSAAACPPSLGLLVGLLVLLLVVLWLVLVVPPKKDGMVQGLAYSFTGVENCVTAALSGSTCGPLVELLVPLDTPVMSSRSPVRCDGSDAVGV